MIVACMATVLLADYVFSNAMLYGWGAEVCEMIRRTRDNFSLGEEGLGNANNLLPGSDAVLVLEVFFDLADEDKVLALLPQCRAMSRPAFQVLRSDFAHSSILTA